MNGLPPRRRVTSWIMALVAGLGTGVYLLVSNPGWQQQGLAINALSVGLTAVVLCATWALVSQLLTRRRPDELEGIRLRAALAWLPGGMILASFAPVYWLAPDHPAMASPARWYVLAVAAMAVLSCHLILFVPRLSRMIQPSGLAVAALIAAYVLGGIALNGYRWRIFTLGNVDSAIVVQSLRYTLEEGRLLFNTLEKASHLGVHNSPVYLLLLPIYALLRTPASFLVILPPLAIGLSAIPFYALTRPRIGGLPALILTAAYLLAPYIMARTTGDLYEMTLLPPLLLGVLYYSDRGRFAPFLVFVVLSLAVKESIGATILAFALYGLVKRRDYRWIAVPALLGAGWLVLSYAVVLPHLGGAVSSRTAALLGSLGDTPGEVIRYALTKPGAFARQVLSPPKIALVYQLFQPLLFLWPLLGGEILLALPALGLNLLAQGGSIGIRAWESAIFGPVLFAAAAAGMRRASHYVPLGERWPDRQTAALLLATAVLCATLACAPYWFRQDDFIARPYLAAQRQAAAQIPPDASVSVPDYMMARFADRPYLQLQTGAPFWADYHLVDMNWINLVRGHRIPEPVAQAYEMLVRQAVEGSGAPLKLLWQSDGLYLFGRGQE